MLHDLVLVEGTTVPLLRVTASIWVRFAQAISAATLIATPVSKVRRASERIESQREELKRGEGAAAAKLMAVSFGRIRRLDNRTRSALTES